MSIKMELKKLDKRVWTEFIWFMIFASGVPCEYGNEPWLSSKVGNFLTNVAVICFSR
jgi:hypothetical protein